MLYQMLKKVNASRFQSGDKDEDSLTDKLRTRIALLNRILNCDDKKTLCSKRDEHPEWFEGLDAGASTKVRLLDFHFKKFNKLIKWL